jgi:hypothetical protein
MIARTHDTHDTPDTATRDAKREQQRRAKVDGLQQGHRVRLDTYDGREVKPGGWVGYGDIRDDREGALWLSDYLGGSDYSGGTLAASNIRVWQRDIDPDSLFTIEAHGAYGTRQLLIVIASMSPDAVECLAALEQYPAIDDEDLSMLELELADESWSGVRSDFVRALEKRGFDLDAVPELVRDGERECMIDPLRAAFDAVAERIAVYWEPDGPSPSVWIDVGKVADACTIDDLPEGAIDTDDDDSNDACADTERPTPIGGAS